MKYGIVYGDIIQMAANGEFDILIHGCNCFCTMGSGVAKQVRAAFPEAYEADLKTTKGDIEKLGSFSHHLYRRPILAVVNAYTQFNYGYGHRRYADPKAIKKAFLGIRETFGEHGLRFAYPRIGCGLGGLRWEIVEDIINSALDGEDHTLVSWSDK